MPTITEKIIQKHLVEGVMERGKPIAIRIDQTLTQDATGTMAYLQLEAMGVDQVKTDLSISYVDHNTLQSGFENADDHKYLQTVAMKHGVRFSRPVTESATRFIWSALQSRKLPFWEVIPIHRLREAWGLWLLEPAVWMLPVPWPACRFISTCRTLSTFGYMVP